MRCSVQAARQLARERPCTSGARGAVVARTFLRIVNRPRNSMNFARGCTRCKSWRRMRQLRQLSAPLLIACEKILGTLHLADGITLHSEYAEMFGRVNILHSQFPLRGCHPSYMSGS